MNRVTFRFYAELNDFLPSQRRFSNFAVEFPAGQTVKHLIESCGIPHTEVDLILVNGVSIGFAYQVQDGDCISVFPVFESLDISSISTLHPTPLRKTAFVMDCHLGRLAAYMRLLGFDVLYRNDYSDAELATISQNEKRICVTRDRGLLKRNQIDHGYLVRATDPRSQVMELMRRFQLNNDIQPFTRCVRCNGNLFPVSVSEVQEKLEPGTLAHFSEFSQCADCGQVYWKGSHYQHLMRFIEFITSEAA
ncbi:MAG TPA: twitching motility protein PilT [Anaerolineaceae bacterium]|nr:twitching motility protein PilT [Anaerolineaceae bacterium]